MTRLTKEEELALIQRFQDGSEKESKEAASIIVEQYRYFVVGIANTFKCRYPTLDDRIQVGLMGLLKALRKFDLNKGCRLTTYSKWWIERDILREIANHGSLIRVPVFQHGNRDLDEIRNTYSLDVPVTTDFQDSMTFADVLVSEQPLFTDCLDDSVQVEIIEKYLERLKPKERRVIRERYGLNQSRERKTCEEVAKILGMTRGNVSRTELKALRRLRLMKEFSKKKVIPSDVG